MTKRKQLIGTLAVAALSGLSWLGWLGWNTGGGDYATWQVAGCALTLLAIFATALLRGLHPLLASVALIIPFSAAWTVNAAAHDDSGLFAVGALMLLIGMTISAAILAPALLFLRRRRAL